MQIEQTFVETNIKDDNSNSNSIIIKTLNKIKLIKYKAKNYIKLTNYFYQMYNKNLIKNNYNYNTNFLRNYYSNKSIKIIFYGFFVFCCFIEKTFAGTNCSETDAIRNCVDGVVIPIW